MSTKELTIDPELRDLLPKLTAEQKAGLRQALIDDEGAFSPIVTWANHEDTIIDGHNRYELCVELDLPFKIKAMPFANRSDVISWMKKHALGQRNLTETQERELIGTIFNETKRESPGRPEKNGDTVTTLNRGGRTSDQVAESEGVSAKTVLRAGKFAEDLKAIPAEAKEKIVSEEIKSSDKAVHDLAALPTGKRNRAAKLIAEGKVDSVKAAVEAVSDTKPKPQSDESPELKDLNKLLDLLGKAVRQADDINRDLFPSPHHANVISALDTACKSAALWKQGAKKR